MAIERSRPTLIFHLGQAPILSMAEKGLFGRVHMRFGRMLMAGLWLYQTGAVLGRSRHDRFEILARMFCHPGQEREFCRDMRDDAAERLDKYGGEPDSFFDFFWKIEYQRAGINWPEDYRAAVQLGKQKMPLQELEPLLKGYMMQGLGLGAGFPELTERLWRKTYEHVDPEAWARARRYGVDVPEQPPPLPLEEQEQAVLLEVAQYATAYFAELVEPLGLRYKEKEAE